MQKLGKKKEKTKTERTSKLTQKHVWDETDAACSKLLSSSSTDRGFLPLHMINISVL